jgi:hypothetical protein
MTAEIAIINRGAVTLAADSAMTLQVRGQEKIYTSADKLFELSTRQPIAIMVYNNLEYMGVPFELAIKQFREAKATHEFKSVDEASAAFFDFLINELKPDDELTKKHVFQLVRPVLQLIYIAFSQEVAKHFSLVTSRKKRLTKKDYPDVQTIFTDIASRQAKRHEAAKMAGTLGDIPMDSLLEKYKEVIDAATEDVFSDLPLEGKDRDLLRLVSIHVLRSTRFSELFTGLVFAGFGSNQMFPALHAFEIDGVVNGVLKYKKTKEFVATRNDLAAEIIPFAQREMADRFLFGVDPEFEAGIGGFLESLLRNTGYLIIKHSKVSKSRVKELSDKLEEAVSASIHSLRNDLIPKAKKKFREQVEDMVLFMPKPELASFAEALVNITSVKRKYSVEQETVAGPVDVAVISKNDGFVWVKRKHYFEPKLNPRYFWRKYGDFGS